MAIDWKRVGADVVTGGLAENYYTGRQLTGNNGTAPAITAPNQPNIPTPAPPGWIYDSNGNLVQGYLDTHGNLIHGVNPANQSPAIPTPGPAPALDLSKFPTLPEQPGQTQQAISGETFNRIKPAIDQYESTTGRRISPTALQALAKSEFETAANRAAQNKQLAMQQYGLELQKYGLVTQTELAKYNADLNKYGIDTNNLFKGAELTLNQYNQDQNRAIEAYGQQLQKYGMDQQTAFQWASLAVNIQIANAQIQAQQNAAAAQGAGAIGGIIGAGAGLVLTAGNPMGGAIGYGVGSTVGSGVSGMFN